MAAETFSLPPEIIGEIVSFVSDDRETLLSCALVCQDWLHESRTFLFRDIDIYSREMFRSFVSNVLRSERLRPSLIKTHDIWVKFFNGMGEGEPEAFVLEISGCLPNLRTMGLTSFPRGENRKGCLPLRIDLFPALSQLASLYELHLGYCGFTSFGELKSVLVTLPALSSLSTVEVSCSDPGETDRLSVLAGPYTRPALSHLSATRTIGDKLYDWLSNTPTRSTLRELNLDFDNIVAGLQMTAGPSSSLTALTIKDMESTRRSGVLADPRFARLSQLFSGKEDIKLLRLHADFVCDGFSWGEMARALRPFASAGAVRVLRLCCCPEHFGEDDGEVFYTGLEELDG